MPDVDFLINCYEQTYREVLAPGYVSDLARAQCFPFAAVTVLVNNVEDRADAEALAKVLLEVDPGVSRVVFVADHLPAALAVTGLRSRHLRRLAHYTDWALVAVSLDGPAWVLHWDADARLREPMDWLTPALARFGSDPQIAVANPQSWFPGLAEREALLVEDGLAIGYGFSDQVFLCRRADFSAPIYRRCAPASWRGPLSHIAPIFEQRVDAWMRRSGRTRCTVLAASYTHEAGFGAGYPAGGTRGRIRRAVMHRFRRWAQALSDHPAMRADPR